MKRLLIVGLLIGMCFPVFAGGLAEKTTITFGSGLTLSSANISGYTASNTSPDLFAQVELPMSKTSNFLIGFNYSNQTISTISMTNTRICCAYRFEVE